MQWYFLMFFAVVIPFTNGLPRIPPNPCPSIFNYYINSNNQIFGEILLPNDWSKRYVLDVNVSYGTLFEESSRPEVGVELITRAEMIEKTSQLTWRIKFSSQDIVPRITNTKQNGRVFCSGPEEPLTPEGVFNLWVKKTYSFTTYPSIPMEQITMPPFITSKPTTTPTNPGQSQAMMDNSQNDAQCGISENSGFSWLVALYKFKGLNYEFMCTANLISRRHVLTVAHCLKFYKADLIRLEEILLVFGKPNMDHWAEKSDSVKRSVKRVDVHPEYRQYTGHGDLAVLTLEIPVDYSKSITPICLWNDYEDLRYVIGKSGTVSGWGKDGNQQEYFTHVKSIEMPIVSNNECLRSNVAFQKLTSDKTFCAGERNGRGVCSEDGGSPFMLQKNGRWSIRGLVSQAISNKASFNRCNMWEYIVLTDVAKYTEWIRSRLF